MPSDVRPSTQPRTGNLERSPERPEFSRRAAADFPYLVPASFARKIEQSSDQNALLRQILPLSEELRDVPGFGRDPLNESPQANEGLVEKYAGRLLVLASQACSGHCRFCFRRHLPAAPARTAEVMAAFRRRMQARDDITEVILSGGDPLVLSDRRIETWFHLIACYPQVRRIRVHTREPVFSPERVTPELAAVISGSPLPVVITVHVNHADELDEASAYALTMLRSAGAMLLTQTVLLKDVNDSADVLAALFERCFECGMTPYYLHQLDRVAGAAHFEVEKKQGLEIVRSLRQRLPGYLVPRYVEEISGDSGKRPIA